MFTKYLEQYQLGETWSSQGRTITEADVVMFSAFSGDWFPLHTDKEYAATTQFGQRIAHGMLVLSVATGLLEFGPQKVLAFYGMDNLRFTAPTFIGDTIHLELEVLHIEQKGPARGVVTAQQKVKKQTGETVAVADMKLLIASE